MAIYDSTSDQCFYLHSSVWDGQVAVNLRLVPTANGQKKGIRFAEDYHTLGVNSAGQPWPSPTKAPPLPLIIKPE
jgi:hypothetical protein